MGGGAGEAPHGRERPGQRHRRGVVPVPVPVPEPEPEPPRGARRRGGGPAARAGGRWERSGPARRRCSGVGKGRDGLRPQHPRLAERRDLLPGLGRVQFPPPDHHHLAGHRHPARPLHQDRRGRLHPLRPRLPEPAAAAALRRPPPQGAQGARSLRPGQGDPLLRRRGGDPDPDQQRQRPGKPRPLRSGSPEGLVWVPRRPRPREDGARALSSPSPPPAAYRGGGR